MIPAESKIRVRRNPPLVLKFETIEEALGFCEASRDFDCAASWMRLLEAMD